MSSNIVTYLSQRINKKVGNGECAGMVSKCFQDLGYKEFPNDYSDGYSDEYVWGDAICGFTVIKGKVDGIIASQPRGGDVIQYRNVKFVAVSGNSTKTSIAKHHTSVVRSVTKTKINIFEQNSGGKRYVIESSIVLSDLKAGRLIFYRPVLKKKK